MGYMKWKKKMGNVKGLCKKIKKFQQTVAVLDYGVISRASFNSKLTLISVCI